MEISEIEKLVKLLKQLDEKQQQALLLIIKGTAVLSGTARDVF